MYLTATSAIRGKYIRGLLKDGNRELMREIPSPTPVELKTMIAYYKAQGLLENNYTIDVGRYLAANSNTTWGLRHLYELIKGEANFSEFMVDNYHDRLKTLIKFYESKTNDEEAKETMSKCIEISFKQVGSAITVKDDWIKYGIVISSIFQLDHYLKVACTRITKLGKDIRLIQQEYINT